MKLFKMFEVPNKPFSLPMRGLTIDPESFTWEDWHDLAKKEYPVRYFLSETLPRFWNQNVVARFIHLKYFIKDKYIRKHHVLSLVQPNGEYSYGWIDSDTQILYACFNILVNFVDHEYGGKVKMQEHIQINKNFGYTEINKLQQAFEIYCWWTEERPKLKKKYEDAVQVWHTLIENKMSSKKEMQLIHSIEDEIKTKEQEMLLMLIQCRDVLWT